MGPGTQEITVILYFFQHVFSQLHFILIFSFSVNRSHFRSFSSIAFSHPTSVTCLSSLSFTSLLPSCFVTCSSRYLLPCFSWWMGPWIVRREMKPGSQAVPATVYIPTGRTTTHGLFYMETQWCYRLPTKNGISKLSVSESGPYTDVKLLVAPSLCDLHNTIHSQSKTPRNS
jgi:hypothetical protein